MPRGAKILSLAIVGCLVLLAVVLGATRGGEPSEAPRAADGQVVFDGDFDTGDLSQWQRIGSVQQQAPGRVQVVRSPTDRSRFAARFEIRPGDNAGAFPGQRRNRTEVGCTTLGTTCVPGGQEQVGDERYFGWSTYFPSDGYPFYEPGPDVPDGEKWQLIMQLNRSGTTPPISVGVVDDQLALIATDLESRFTYLYRGPLVRDRWHRFVLRVMHSPDPSVGYVELWLDGRQVTPRTAVATMRQEVDGVAVESGGTPRPNTPKLGIYRYVGTPTRQVLFHDSFRIGTTRASVDPSARR